MSAWSVSMCVSVKGRAHIDTTARSTPRTPCLIQLFFWQQTELGGSPILMRFISPSSVPSLCAFREKQWPLLHLSPRCQCEHDPGIIYLPPHFLFIKWRPVSACPWSNLHFLISCALLLFKFVCCLAKMDGCVDGWMGNVVALAPCVHHPEQQIGNVHRLRRLRGGPYMSEERSVPFVLLHLWEKNCRFFVTRLCL